MSADVASAASMGIGTALPPAPDPALLDDLVAANRILCDHGILDAYGHISARDPQHREHYWISRSMPPALVTAADIIACDLDNNPVRQGETRLFFERVIHGEIYKARPDVMAVLHSHSPHLIPFCNSDTRLRPMVGSAAFLGEGAPVFETSASSTTTATSMSAPFPRPGVWRWRSALTAWCCCAATARSRSAIRSAKSCATPSLRNPTPSSRSRPRSSAR